MISILANFKIDSKVKLFHLKKSCSSFEKISDNWVINVRGKFRKEAIDYLKKKLYKKVTFFNLLDETRGWSVNTLQMLKALRYNYVLLWNEDHCNLAKQNIYHHILKEMEKDAVSYLLYSWWDFGNCRKAFNTLSLDRGKYIDSIMLSNEIWEKVRKMGHKYYLVSLIGIFNKTFLKNLLIKDTKYLPYFITPILLWWLGVLDSIGCKMDERERFGIINKLLFYKLRKYPKYTPFNLEMEPNRYDVLPFKLGLPKQELFACIDDNHGYENYSLIKRGLFPY